MIVPDYLLSDYNRWVAERTAVMKSAGARAIVQTPWLDRHNDCIQITIEASGDEWLLTDDGFAIGDWEEAGHDPESPDLRAVLRGFGVHRAGRRLQVRASAGAFPTRMHSLLQAVMAVSHMADMAEPPATRLTSSPA
jgi:hypothetical protein